MAHASLRFAFVDFAPHEGGRAGGCGMIWRWLRHDLPDDDQIVVLQTLVGTQLRQHGLGISLLANQPENPPLWLRAGLAHGFDPAL